MVMAIWASNPVTLNRQQILHARNEGVIVRALVVDVAAGQCEVIEQWPAAELGDTLHVTNLEQAAARPGASYLLPLLPEDGGYTVAPCLAGIPLVYVDTPDAIAQLEELLTE